MKTNPMKHLLAIVGAGGAMLIYVVTAFSGLATYVLSILIGFERMGLVGAMLSAALVPFAQVYLFFSMTARYGIDNLYSLLFSVSVLPWILFYGIYVIWVIIFEKKPALS